MEARKDCLLRPPVPSRDLLRAADRKDWSRNKTLHAAEESRPDVAEQKRQWSQRLSGASAVRLVFVDESGPTRG
jgi:hypothetical protein